MQGRLLPDNSNYLQYFPQNHWKEEYTIAETLGFEYIELLYDIEQSNQNPLVNYKKNNEAAGKILTVGTTKRDESLNAPEHAAWTIVASIILNLDEVITRL